MKNKVLALAFAFVGGSAFALELNETTTAMIDEAVKTLCGEQTSTEDCAKIKADLEKVALESESVEQLQEIINNLIAEYNKACSQCQKQKEKHNNKK